VGVSSHQGIITIVAGMAAAVAGTVVDMVTDTIAADK